MAATGDWGDICSDQGSRSGQGRRSVPERLGGQAARYLQADKATGVVPLACLQCQQCSVPDSAPLAALLQCLFHVVGVLR